MTGLFLPWHRQYLQTFEGELRSKCGYDGVHPYWDWTQGNASHQEFWVSVLTPNSDTADFYNATIFSDSPYDGLGSWGDPDNDFQISTGGLNEFRLAYPVPHNLRRNFTLQPFLHGLAGTPPGVTIDPALMLNTTFTKENVDFILKSFAGDFIAFQTYTEGISGPHPGPHLILGGDMGGTCPFGLGPPGCNPGMKWSSNGKKG